MRFLMNYLLQFQIVKRQLTCIRHLFKIIMLNQKLHRKLLKH
ncbi:Uncharacterised protein [Acinetobacter baumannii]|nr:Uncharacterised protein [Acinetobacter baumannii]